MIMIPFSDQRLTVMVIVAIIALCLMCAALVPVISGRGASKKRALNIVRRNPDARMLEARTTAEIARRRKMITESVNALNAEKKQSGISLEVRLEQAGITLSPVTFVALFSAAGVIAGLIVYFAFKDILIASGFASLIGLALPLWLLGYLRKKRIDKFLLGFPLALDTIVRGVRSGLPLSDCLSVIANEAAEPVRGEFRRMVEGQAVGLSIGDAAERIAERIPVPETTFFSIILSIQQSTGGNLGESLANLSEVLRERKKLRDKVSALTAEGIVSACIIGALPFFVLFALFFLQPEYISTLFETDSGLKLVGFAAFWMSLGIVFMKKMINFDV